MRKIVRIKVLGIHPHGKFAGKFMAFLGLENKTYESCLVSDKQANQLDKLLKSKDAFAILDYSNPKYVNFVWCGSDYDWLKNSKFMGDSPQTPPPSNWMPPEINSPFTEQDLPF